jgi:hypothetical protein
MSQIGHKDSGGIFMVIKGCILFISLLAIINVVESQGIVLDPSQFKPGSTNPFPTESTQIRELTPNEIKILAKLDVLAIAARYEGPDGIEFADAIDSFSSELKRRLVTLHQGDRLPDDLRIVETSLNLWAKDPGDKWGYGTNCADDLTLTYPNYAVIPKDKPKCNIFIAEVLFNSVGLVHEAQMAKSFNNFGKYYPYSAYLWSDTATTIPSFAITTSPKMGDIWSNGAHVGIYLGNYNNRQVYISARNDAKGVFGADWGVQKDHGIQIKFLPVENTGMYRHYTP